VRAILIVILALACAVAGYFLLQPTDVDLIAFETPPRDDVIADPEAGQIGLSVVDDPFNDFGNPLRRARNQLAKDLALAIKAHQDGKGSLRDAERIEMRLWVARRQLDEIDDAAYHAHVAILFDRERQRLEILSKREPPLASSAAVERARLYTLREQHLAGATDAGYGEAREAFLASALERIEHLRSKGSGEYESLRDDYNDWVAEFPAP